MSLRIYVSMFVVLLHVLSVHRVTLGPWYNCARVVAEILSNIFKRHAWHLPRN